mmetsp:Transcript_43214/g.101633  ORF Transcript_43214/g.101633 Transcript_43214/m.101633 type:complete len:219 (+) Transcript_43214:132-788(+)
MSVHGSAPLLNSHSTSGSLPETSAAINGVYPWGRDTKLIDAPWAMRISAILRLPQLMANIRGDHPLAMSPTSGGAPNGPTKVRTTSGNCLCTATCSGVRPPDNGPTSTASRAPPALRASANAALIISCFVTGAEVTVVVSRSASGATSSQCCAGMQAKVGSNRRGLRRVDSRRCTRRNGSNSWRSKLQSTWTKTSPHPFSNNSVNVRWRPEEDSSSSL